MTHSGPGPGPGGSSNTTTTTATTNTNTLLFSLLLHWTLFILYTIIQTLLSIFLSALQLISRSIGFVLLPLGVLGQFLLACMKLPWEVAGRFEILYIFLGVAGIVGLAAGVAMGACILGLQKVVAPRRALTAQERRTRVRSVQDYREEKREERSKDFENDAMEKKRKKMRSSGGSGSGSGGSGGSNSRLSPSSVQGSWLDGARRRRALFTQTIMEEEDSDF